MAYDIELLKEADEAYRGSVEVTTQRAQDLRNAEQQKAVALEQRTKRYSEAFAGGIVIKRIVDLPSVTYLAGYHDEWDEIVPEWLCLEADHAKNLQGAYALSVGISNYNLRNGNSSDLELDFEVVGVNTNAEVDENIFWPGADGEPTSTSYHAQLEAIKWRLPTGDEVATFGSFATQSAHLRLIG